MSAREDLAAIDAELERVVTTWMGKSPTLEDFAGLHQGLDQINRTLAQLRRDVERGFVDAMPTRREVLDGIGVVEKKRKTDRRGLDRESLERHVLARALDAYRVDKETGEVVTNEEAQLRAVRECFRLEPRWEPIRALGLDDEDFYEQITENGYGIKIT